LDQRVRKTRQRLRTALFELLEQQSIESITTTKLCQVAGISRRTFYIHYGNVTEIFEDYENDMANLVAQRLTQTEGSAAKLLETFDQILMANFKGFKYLCLNEKHHQLMDRIQRMLFQTFSASLFDAELTGRQQIILNTLTTGLINAYVYWFAHPDALSYDELIQVNQQLVETLMTEITR
jgi:AcrR family transcriptional regulator